MKSWKRANNFDYVHRKMKDKYNFSLHLRMVGDWVETGPLSLEDRKRIVKAAHIWAYRKKYQVKTEVIGADDGFGIKIYLKAKYR